MSSRITGLEQVPEETEIKEQMKTYKNWIIILRNIWVYIVAKKQKQVTAF